MGAPEAFLILTGLSLGLAAISEEPRRMVLFAVLAIFLGFFACLAMVVSK